MAVTDICACTTSESPYLERVRFFARQLVTPDDLTQDQEYFRSKMRRHNRLLHGWGVVCGAGVTTGQKPSEVVVQPGYVLGPFGDEILIHVPTTVDVCAENADGNAAECGAGPDPWCGDVRMNRRPEEPLYLAVKYAQCQSRPIRAYPSGCGCNEADCEYSRVRDGYALKLLTKLPTSYDPMPPSDEGRKCPENMNDCGRPCPPCPEGPWVILADILVNNDCSVADIDCRSHRRMVATSANYYLVCPPVIHQ